MTGKVGPKDVQTLPSPLPVDYSWIHQLDLTGAVRGLCQTWINEPFKVSLNPEGEGHSSPFPQKLSSQLVL